MIREQAMDGLFPTIFHGERSELREKYELDLSRIADRRANRHPGLAQQHSGDVRPGYKPLIIG